MIAVHFDAEQTCFALAAVDVGMAINHAEVLAGVVVLEAHLCVGTTSC